MDKPKEKIIVVDDEPEIAGIIRSYLMTRGYEVITAEGGQEALQILSNDTASLMLMDIMMPGLNGMDLARIIRAQYPGLKVITVTAYEDFGKRLLEEGLVDALLVKPIRLGAISDKLLELLRKDDFMAIAEPATKMKTTARIFMIKAGLLILEPSAKQRLRLEEKFASLADKGEFFKLEFAGSASELLEKSSLFHPDICLVNSVLFKQENTDILASLGGGLNHPAEVIVYPDLDSDSPANTNLEKLIHSIEITCVLKGFIRIKWVEL